MFVVSEIRSKLLFRFLIRSAWSPRLKGETTKVDIGLYRNSGKAA